MHIGKNKIFLSLLLLIVISLGVGVTVYAVNTSGDYSGGSLDTTQSGSGSTLYPSPYFDGIRVSFVKGDGTDVASVDFIDDSQYKNNTSAIVKTTSSTCSRPAYSNGKCSFSWNGGVSIGSAARPVSELQALFTNVTLDNGKKYSFPVSLASKVASDSYTGIFDGLYKERNTSLSQEEYDQFIYKLFNNMLSKFGSSTTVDDYEISGEKNALYNLFLVFEPITIVKMNGSTFMGTAYELAREAKTQKAGGWKNSEGEAVCKGSSNGALCDLGSVLRKLVPCKSYLDGNIINSIKEQESTILIKNFPDGYYFNNIKIDYTNSKNKCSYEDGRLDVSVVTGNYGVGMGVIWLGDVYSGTGNSCSAIYEKIGFENNNANNSMFSSFKNAFETGGTQAIYDLYPTGTISALDGSEEIDVKWFVNNCTCFGMYEHYANTTVATYKLNNQTSIDSFSSKFGSSDWFIEPGLTLTKGWIINSRFPTSFATYNQTWKAYSESKNLEWDDKDGNDYVNALECGTQEKYWCDEFNTWYEDMRSKYSSLRSYPSINTIKNSSLAVINSRYKEQLQTMIDAYNLNFSIANGFNWTLEATDSGTNFSYIKNCINADTASCQTIINFYSQNQGVDLNMMACDKLENDFDFSAYNNRYGTDITGQWFVSTCGCTQATSYDCTPNYSVGSCTNNDDIIYTDSSNGVIDDEYWDYCVFDDYGSYDIDPHKVSDHGSDLTYYESELGDDDYDYCEVYCIEDLSASLAKPNITVEAGSRFTWGYSSVEGSRTCKTKSVEWDKFEDDLEEANDNIVDTYVDYQLEKLKKESIANATHEPSTSCDCIVNLSVSKGGSTCCVDRDYGEYCSRRVKVSSTGCGKDDKSPCYETEWYNCYKCTEHDYSTDNRYELYEAEPVEFGVTAVYGTDKYDSWSGDNWCSGGSTNTTKPTYDSTTASGTYYEQAKKKAQSIIDAMKSCYTWDQEDIYQVDPQATIIYSDDINYYYKDELDKSTSYSFSDESICTVEDVEQIKNCSGERCDATDVTMKNCSGDDQYVQMTRKATTRFLLKDNVFRYVLKSNHLSIHPDDLGNHNVANFTTNYIDIGFSNFPVSFSAPDGLYGTTHNQGQFDVEYSNLGHIENGKTAIDTIMSNSALAQGSGEEYGKWVCEYQVYSDLLPEDDPGKDNGGIGDIDLIYRPIDLHNPFPDIDSSNRDTGSNWCDEDGNCSYNNQSVQAYIYENRDVDYEEVYNIEPMYTFVLTPAIVKEIREYNDQNSYSSYTGSLGTTQYFDYVCGEGTGNACVSEYLSYLIDITNAKNRPGTCVDDKYRNANDSGSFYGCRY